MRWKLKKNGGFHIRFHYKALRISPSVIFPWKGIWRVKAPKRVSFFDWTVAWVKILIGGNLRRKGFIFVDRCCMCQCCGENLIIYCFIVRRLKNCGFFSFDLLGSLGSYEEQR